MKNFINIFITIILVLLGVGISYLQVNNTGAWFFLFIPLIIMMFIWGRKLYEDY